MTPEPTRLECEAWMRAYVLRMLRERLLSVDVENRYVVTRRDAQTALATDNDVCVQVYFDNAELNVVMHKVREEYECDFDWSDACFWITQGRILHLTRDQSTFVLVAEKFMFLEPNEDRSLAQSLEHAFGRNVVDEPDIQLALALIGKEMPEGSRGNQMSGQVKELLANCTSDLSALVGLFQFSNWDEAIDSCTRSNRSLRSGNKRGTSNASLNPVLLSDQSLPLPSTKSPESLLAGHLNEIGQPSLKLSVSDTAFNKPTLSRKSPNGRGKRMHLKGGLEPEASSGDEFGYMDVNRNSSVPNAKKKCVANRMETRSEKKKFGCTKTEQRRTGRRLRSSYNGEEVIVLEDTDLDERVTTNIRGGSKRQKVSGDTNRVGRKSASKDLFPSTSPMEKKPAELATSPDLAKVVIKVRNIRIQTNPKVTNWTDRDGFRVTCDTSNAKVANVQPPYKPIETNGNKQPVLNADMPAKSDSVADFPTKAQPNVTNPVKQPNAESDKCRVWSATSKPKRNEQWSSRDTDKCQLSNKPAGNVDTGSQTIKSGIVRNDDLQNNSNNVDFEMMNRQGPSIVGNNPQRPFNVCDPREGLEGPRPEENVRTNEDFDDRFVQSNSNEDGLNGVADVALAGNNEPVCSKEDATLVAIRRQVLQEQLRVLRKQAHLADLQRTKTELHIRKLRLQVEKLEHDRLFHLPVNYPGDGGDGNGEACDDVYAGDQQQPVVREYSID